MAAFTGDEGRGIRDGAELLRIVVRAVERRGLQSLRAELVESERGYAVVLHCETDRCGASDLKALKRDLEQEGARWGLAFRVQREELFLAMHRV